MIRLCSAFRGRIAIALFMIFGLLAAMHYAVLHYKDQRFFHAQEARTSLIKAQAAKYGVPLLSEETLKKTVADNIGLEPEDFTLRFAHLTIFKDGHPIGFTPKENDDFLRIREALSYLEDVFIYNRDVSPEANPEFQMALRSFERYHLERRQMKEHFDAEGKESEDKPYRPPLPPLDCLLGIDGKSFPTPSAQNGEKDSSETPQIPVFPDDKKANLLMHHPLYFIIADSDTVSYELLIDAVNGQLVQSRIE